MLNTETEMSFIPENPEFSPPDEIISGFRRYYLKGAYLCAVKPDGMNINFVSIKYDGNCGSMTGDNSQSEQLHQEKAQSVCTRNSGKITQKRNNMKIPKIIQETAKQHGFNNVNFVGEIDGSQVFGCSNVGNNGLVIPQGLPTLITLKNGETKFINGDEGLELASRLVKP